MNKHYTKEKKFRQKPLTVTNKYIYLAIFKIYFLILNEIILFARYLSCATVIEK